MSERPGADRAEHSPAGAPAPVETCASCLKPQAVCVCDAISPIENRVEVLVLQHPQERDKVLGTGLLTTLHLAKAQFKIGLSWASLSAALGRPADPRRWAILYLAPEGAAPPGGVAILDGKRRPSPNPRSILARLEGVILLDGSWSQAKTLWWRNPWVLKTHHLAIGPKTPSLYGKLRREPRRDSLSTIEAAAFALSRIEGRPDIETLMLSTFRRMLQRYRDTQLPRRTSGGIRPAGNQRRRRPAA